MPPAIPQDSFVTGIVPPPPSARQFAAVKPPYPTMPPKPFIPCAKNLRLTCRSFPSEGAHWRYSCTQPSPIRPRSPRFSLSAMPRSLLRKKYRHSTLQNLQYSAVGLRVLPRPPLIHLRFFRSRRMQRPADAFPPAAHARPAMALHGSGLPRKTQKLPHVRELCAGMELRSGGWTTPFWGREPLPPAQQGSPLWHRAF